jgi:DNA invertase Pin-like site-specific DNA recombinase
VLYCRVSDTKQKREGNLAHQIPYLRRRVERLGKEYGVTIEILDEPFGEDIQGWRLYKSYRKELVKAAKLAREHDAVLVATHTSRFVRNQRYQRYKTLPTVEDFEQLVALVGGARLATVFQPDRQEARGADTKRGHKARNAKPGRPKKRRYGPRLNEFKRLRVRRLLREGKTLGDIARRMKRPKSTVQGWVYELNKKATQNS